MAIGDVIALRREDTVPRTRGGLAVIDGVVTLRCGDCGLPFARLQNGVLMVQSKHHGEKHVNGVAVDELVKMCQEGVHPMKREAILGVARQSWPGVSEKTVVVWVDCGMEWLPPPSPTMDGRTVREDAVPLVRFGDRLSLGYSERLDMLAVRMPG